jgi:hypothetical protein
VIEQASTEAAAVASFPRERLFFPGPAGSFRNGSTSSSRCVCDGLVKSSGTPAKDSTYPSGHSSAGDDRLPFGMHEHCIRLEAQVICSTTRIQPSSCASTESGGSAPWIRTSTGFPFSKSSTPSNPVYGAVPSKSFGTRPLLAEPADLTSRTHGVLAFLGRESPCGIAAESDQIVFGGSAVPGANRGEDSPAIRALPRKLDFD